MLRFVHGKIHLDIQDCKRYQEFLYVDWYLGVPKKLGVDMNTLDELIYYCEEKEPVGALMLIGEWGCGKTYLIEHELSDKLKESHVIIRVSLFGITWLRS